MDVLASECSSGCESGWTLYLEHSHLSPSPSHRGTGNVDEYKEKRAKHEDEEEDLSMVSDASSGPPHFHEDDDYFNDNSGCFYPASMDATLVKANSGKRQKTKEHRCRREEQQQPSLLDDTASSPVFNFSRNNFTLTKNQPSRESILGFSANHFEGGSTFQNQIGILQSPLSGNQLQQNQWFGGKRVGMR
ncbi:hypothetical protein L1049_015243 [Liquidambar formosana]|uniref:Uncharacterized protein n=1 Tax=Liquidambar formosana TaxID=63359 RepID=A0AAP0X603_LIQFO